MVTELSQLGRYALREILGDGGFATVYRAWDPILGREVALKALLPHLARQPDVRQRFLAEVRSLASLRHANIVGFLDVGEADGLPFFTMELVDGPTLAQLMLRRGPQPLEAVAAMLSDLASALDYIHAAGLIHRDIKAANVMLDGAGRTVLMDFGVVRALDQTQFTQTGAALGTPETMAPEQVRGLPTGPATDIYALGILAYQLLAGRPPFVGDTAYVLHAQAYEPPPPLHQWRRDLPERVYRAVEWALAKEPLQRPHSATAFAFALGGPPAPTKTDIATARQPDNPRPPTFATPAGSELPPEPHTPPVQIWEDVRPDGRQGRPRWLLPAAGASLLLVIVVIALVGVGMLLKNGQAQHGPAASAPTAAALNAAVSAPSSTAATPAVASPTPLPPTPSPSPTPPPALSVSNVRVENTVAWARGGGDLTVCFDPANARSGSSVRVLLTRGAALDQGIADATVPLSAGQVNACATLPHGGAQPAGKMQANVLDAAGKLLGPPAAFTPPPPLRLANPDFGDPQPWGLGNQPLQACADVHDAQTGDALVLRVLTADGDYVGQSDSLVLSPGDATHVCLTLAAAGRQPANSYVAVLYAVYGDQWSELSRSDPFTIAPPPAPTVVPRPVPAAPVSQPQAAPVVRQPAPASQPAPAVSAPQPAPVQPAAPQSAPLPVQSNSAPAPQPRAIPTQAPQPRPIPVQ